MSKDPAVLFYTSDFLSGTSFFTDEQVGQYIRLLCQQHQLWSIPENHMIFICKSLDSPVVKKFTKDDSGNYYQHRMRKEAVKRANFCNSRGNNKKGRFKTDKKENHMKITSKSYENHMENIDENESDHTSIPNKTTVFNFDIIWDKYPKRVGKKESLRHFRASVKTEQDYDAIFKALENYLKSERVFNGFVQNGSTWFNNWQDWLDHKEDICEKCKNKGKYVSSTGYEVFCSCPKGRNL